MRLCIYLLFLLVCVSCSDENNYYAIPAKALSNTIKEIESTHNLILFGYGAGKDKESEALNRVMLTFSSHGNVDIQQARSLIIQIVEKIKAAINSSESLKPLLNTYPFQSSNVEVSIHFLNDTGGFVEHGCVYLGTGGVSLVRTFIGKVFYASFNPRTQMLERYYNEPYEEAFSLVQACQEVHCDQNRDSKESLN